MTKKGVGGAPTNLQKHVKKLQKKNADWDERIYIKEMYHLGHTQAKIAESLGVGQSTVAMLLAKCKGLTTFEMKIIKRQAESYFTNDNKD